jgi:hexosaminidase
MWSEMVDGQTLESRVWPRAAAVGEKLWSPGVLTSDTEDMYRRLMQMDERLEQLGLKHRSYNQAILRDLAPAEYQKALRLLTSLLEEDRFFARMEIYDPQLYTTTPLTRVVDAAPAESYVAYRFARDVEDWMNRQDPSAYKRILNSLEDWSEIHRSLDPAFENNPWLEDVREHAFHASQLAELALKTLYDPDSVEESWEDLQQVFASAKVPHGGTILAVVDPVQKLVSSASGK